MCVFLFCFAFLPSSSELGLNLDFAINPVCSTSGVGAWLNVAAPVLLLCQINQLSYTNETLKKVKKFQCPNLSRLMI